MSRHSKQSQVLVYQDVLCPWSWLAEMRLAPLHRELADVLRFVPRPYPLRPMESLPSEDEISRAVKDLTSAAREREALPLRPELWTSGDSGRAPAWSRRVLGGSPACKVKRRASSSRCGCATRGSSRD